MDDKERNIEDKKEQQIDATSQGNTAAGAASENAVGEGKEPEEGAEKLETGKEKAADTQKMNADDSRKKNDDDACKNADAVRNKDNKQEKGGKKDKHVFNGVLGNKTIEDVIKREAKEEQDTSSPFSLPRTLGGVMIARAFQKQMGLVCLVCVFFIIYINNRYICQKKMVEIDKIERKMVDARYKATVCTSILTEKSRESNIMQLLGSYGDSTLTIPNEPPYLIRVEE